jgi:hypothetical protein
MGITNFGMALLDKYIEQYNPKSVMELGAQNIHIGEEPFLYADTYYTEKGMTYECIDLNGENNAHVIDLGIQHMFPLQYELVTDLGTSEHVSFNHKFSWDAIYNCWYNKHALLKVGGVMINENPKQQNWPLHGVNYYSERFYHQLIEYADYEVLELGKHAAMHNIQDGWEIYCVLRKLGDRFPTLDQFMTFDLKQS